MSDSSVKEQREAIGMSQRELSKRSGIPQAKLSRIESGALEPTGGDLQFIAITINAVKGEAIDHPEQKGLPSAGVPRMPSTLRRAFVCRKCRARTFLIDEPPEFVPECSQHGPMIRQANVPYMGKSTEPGPGHPPAKEDPRTVLR